MNLVIERSPQKNVPRQVKQDPEERSLELRLGVLLCGSGLLVDLNGSRIGTLAEEDDLDGNIVTKRIVSSVLS